MPHHAKPLMPVYEFSLLIQAAGTGLLFLLLVLVYQKIRLPALLEWIVSWGLLLVGLGLLWVAPRLEPQRDLAFFTHAALLAHALFLLRGIRRLRDPAGGRLADLVWFLPVLLLALLTSSSKTSPSAAAGGARWAFPPETGSATSTWHGPGGERREPRRP